MKYYVLVLLGILSSEIIFSQPIIREEGASSPGAFKFARFGAIPMSLYTGKPNISIDLISISNGPLEVPFSISYDPSSVKVNAAPAYVGLGWSLIGGGVIIRQKRGQADERITVDSTKTGYFYHASEAKALWNSSDNVNQICTFPDDVEADIFNFNVLGHTGTFYYSSDGWVVNSDDNFIVSINAAKSEVDIVNLNSRVKGSPWNASKHPNTISIIKLIDSKGNAYYFGGNDAVELSTTYGSNDDECDLISTSFMLRKITDPSKKYEISFEYEAGNPVVDLSFNVFWNSSQVISLGKILGKKFDCYSGLFSNGTTIDGNLIFPCYLSKVTAGEKVLKFNSSYLENSVYSLNDLGVNAKNTPVGFNTLLNSCSNNLPKDREYLFLDALKWKKLNNIQLYVNNIIKDSIVFENVSKLNRNFLLSLSRYGLGMDKVPPYKFKYDEENSFPKYRTSPGDHWGYYNGFSDDWESMYNNTPEYYHFPNALFAKIGLLNTIEYPTGGENNL